MNIVPNIVGDVRRDVPYHNRDGPELTPSQRLKHRIAQAKINRELLLARENRKQSKKQDCDILDLLELL